MRHPSTERDWSPRQRAAALLIGAALTFPAAMYLTISSVDYALHGCACDESWYPDWIWVPVLALAPACFVATLTLIVRGTRALWALRNS